jgi:hypothetical protein
MGFASRGFYSTLDPFPLKPMPVCAGAGFDGNGCGLPWKTPGLPMTFPKGDGESGLLTCEIALKVAKDINDSILTKEHLDTLPM